MNKTISFASLLLATTCYSTSFAGNPEDDFFQYAEEKVMQAISSQRTWGGPTEGPAVLHEKNIILSPQTYVTAVFMVLGKAYLKPFLRSIGTFVLSTV